jgi:hypothetical protein
VDAATLLQLPASCTELEAGGPRFTDAAAAVVAQLTHLKKLTLCNTAAGFTDVGLLELTSLRELSALALNNCKGFGEGALPTPDEDNSDEDDSDDYDGGSLCLSDDKVSQVVRVLRCHRPASNGPGRDSQYRGGVASKVLLVRMGGSWYLWDRKQVGGHFHGGGSPAQVSLQANWYCGTAGWMGETAVQSALPRH